MKSNAERVKSILEKAKKYKHQRLQIISFVTIMVCICAIVFIGNEMLFNKNKNNYFITTRNDDRGGSNGSIEEDLFAFNSKEELINMLKEKAEEAKYNNYLGSFSIREDAASISFKQEDNLLSTVENHSSTNLQEENVDESDIIKTNGKYIYYLNNKENALFVLEDKENKLTLVKEIDFEKGFYNDELYLDDKYIIVIGNHTISRESINEDKNNREIYSNATEVLVYDINSYELLRQIETEGNIVSSRKIDNDIYLVTNKYISFYDFYEDCAIPIYKDSNVSGDYLELPISKIKCFDEFEEDVKCNYMIITSFNLDDIKSEININSYLGAGNEIYCSTENLYVTKTSSTYIGSSSGDDTMSNKFIGSMMVDSSLFDVNTNIHKFKIDNGNIKYVTTGKVSGGLLNQFSMGEYNNYFGITTTDGNDGNNIYVLDKNLNEVGKLEGLASGERIYSTRFMGDKVYVVTYKTVDPLFVIDLSNPEKPEVLGELKIPGFSSYLHPLSDKYLLGFGEDSVEKSYLNGEGKTEVTAYTNGIKMSIFDVSDFSNPKELHTIKIGARGSYSNLLNNHKALLIDEEKGVIAFPATVTSDEGVYDDGIPKYGKVTFKGALVYNFSIQDGFRLKGKLEHNMNEANVQRIIYIGNKYYTVSTDIIKSWNMETVEEIDSFKF